MNVRGKQALVTGGASGIGFECVKLLLRNRIENVVIFDKDVSKWKESEGVLLEEFPAERVHFYPCDVREAREFEETFRAVEDDLGRMDVVINNAGIFDDGDWENTVRTNFVSIGTARCLLRAVEHMGEYRRSESGVVVNVSSISGISPIPGCPVYSATKSALVSLGRSFSAPFYENKYGVRVMNICPSLTMTEMGANIMDKFLSPDTRDEWFRTIEPLLPMLDPASVAEEIMRMIREGRNGATWICEPRHPTREVIFKHEKSKL